jgi:hypothetical protein
MMWGTVLTPLAVKREIQSEHNGKDRAELTNQRSPMIRPVGGKNAIRRKSYELE